MPYGTPRTEKERIARHKRLYGNDNIPVRPYTRNANNPIITDPLYGGLAYGMSPGDFDQVELEKGIKVEMEHTNDPIVATRIAMDHLVEHPDYYKELEKMEKKLEEK